MSVAFDTINRQKLLDVIEEDELRLIRFQLSNTHIKLKVNGTEIRVSFLSNTETPEGESLSPVLFIIYLEYAI